MTTGKDVALVTDLGPLTTMDGFAPEISNFTENLRSGSEWLV